MNILSVTHQYPPYHQGGRAKHIQSLFEALSEKGVKIDIITLGESTLQDQKNNITVHLLEPVFKIDALNKFYFIFKADEIAKKLKKDKKFDIILSHSTDGAFLSKNEIPFIVKLHGFRASWIHLHDKLMRRLYYEFERYLERKALTKADEIIAVSEMVKRDVKEYYGRESVVHENAISDLFLDYSPTNSYSDENKDYLLMVGSFVKRKGCHLIPEILQRFRGKKAPKLIHLGSISDKKLYSDVKQELRAKGLKRNFKALGTVDRTDLCRFYRQARLLIHPAVYDPFPKAPMEALAMGTPVVVSEKTGGYAELKKRTPGIYIYSLKDFPENVVDAYNSAGKDKINIDAIKTWDKVGEETLKFFEKVSSR